MKKGIITMSVLAIIACTITAYCWAAGNESVSESTNVAQSLSGQQVKSTSQNAKGKALVVYFSVPETVEWMLLPEPAALFPMVK